MTSINISLSYFELYKSNKEMYLKMQINKIGGGNSKSRNIKKIIMRDIKKVNRQLELRNNPKYIKKLQKKSRHTLRQLSRANSTTDNVTIPPNIFKIDLELTGRYLEKYNKHCTLKYCPENLLKSGYYEYQYKLKQHLSRCGVNRTTQLYGTCWLNSVINSILFGDHIRGKFIQLLIKHSKKNNNFSSIIKKVHETNYELTKKIEKNEFIIFQHIISILYKVLCDEGMRNKNPDQYENMSTTNLALSFIKRPWSSEPITEENPIKILKNSAFYSSAALSMIIDIMNGYLDSYNKPDHSDHIMYDTDKYGNKIDYFGNDEHINHLYFDIYSEKKYTIYPGAYYNARYDNIHIKMHNNNSEKIFSMKNTEYGYKLKKLNNVQFIFLYNLAQDLTVKQINDYIICTIDDKKTKFKLDSAVIYFQWKHGKTKGGHYISGLICKDEYYIYDQDFDAYFKIDWRRLDEKSFEPYITFTRAIFGQDATISDIRLLPAIYCNENIDYSYDINKCMPRRPTDILSKKK